MRRKWLLSLLSLFLLSWTTPEPSPTAQELWENPLPIPDFLSVLNTTPVVYLDWTEAICASIEPVRLWRLGNQAEMLYRHIVDNLEITVDEVVQDDLSIAQHLSLMIILDPFIHRIPLGTAGGSVYICFNAENILPGIHIAKIQTETTWGETYYHEWAIRIE